MESSLRTNKRTRPEETFYSQEKIRVCAWFPSQSKQALIDVLKVSRINANQLWATGA
jgi:hypothetical protein